MVEGEDGTMAKSPEEYWYSFIPVVQDAINIRTQVPSRSGRATYRIWKYDSSDERLFIENENTGRKNSSIGKQEFLISITKLLDAGGVVDCGEMNSVGLHEVVIAVIHPWLDTDGEVIRSTIHMENGTFWFGKSNKFLSELPKKVIFPYQDPEVIILLKADHDDGTLWEVKYVYSNDLFRSELIYRRKTRFMPKTFQDSNCHDAVWLIESDPRWEPPRPGFNGLREFQNIGFNTDERFNEA